MRINFTLQLYISIVLSQVVAEKNHVLHNKQIDPKRAVAGGSGGGAGGEGIRKIFVGGLDPSLTEDNIITHFSQYGKVRRLTVLHINKVLTVLQIISLQSCILSPCSLAYYLLAVLHIISLQSRILCP